MIQSADSVALIVFILVQWRITVVWLRYANRRFAGNARLAARLAIFFLDLVVAAGCIADTASSLGHPVFSSTFTMFLSAAVLAYCMSATAVLALHYVLVAIRKAVRADFHPGRRRVLNAARDVVMAAPFVAMAYGALIERSNFGVREVDVPLPGLPTDLDGLRVLHLSDIHLSPFLSEDELARVIDASNELRAHVVMVTGDLISSHRDPLEACIRQLARLKADAGIFGCLGNHERYARVERRTVEASARYGIRFLRGQAQQLRFGNSILNVAGVDYQPLSDRANYLRGADRLVAPGAVNLLLSHNPDVFPVAARQGYHLVLAGHTHGGQVSVEILDQSINPARFFTPYVYGLYRAESSAAYVTRGIGTIGIPVRVGAPPEITLVRLRKA
ncbi:MAG TPA: metallophosphoesterase [Bryobacteraceae bacterium]|nr:metallophosphoesterase [Bryobacteraceae bacterium]